MKKDSVIYLTGSGIPDARPLKPYSDEACSFLAALSDLLSRHRNPPDVATLAFFCRRANIARLKSDFSSPDVRLGRGTVFHIAPSNIPINFAFSLVFGLLSGNSNVVRVPSKAWPQVDIVCGAINSLLERPEFSEFAHRIAMVRYERDDDVTRFFSERCDARIVWGGDETVRRIRSIPIPPRAVEVSFADRYSFCVISEESVMKLDNVAVARLANNFYNDTYLVDQNACSSPSLIMWLTGPRRAPGARERFWSAVWLRACEYDLAPIHAVDKYTELCCCLSRVDDVESVVRHGNLIYRLKLASLNGVEGLCGKFGFFFEYESDNIDVIASHVTSKWQTLTYFGVEKPEISRFVADNFLRGIDRIVPVGSALDISVMWDGFDIVRTLSRIVEIK
ncbi:MAG: hypothetical protein LBI74_03115 [Synergistaceae bacterium]|jgi:hypothetical protein|nr:hypothetical protein [Synergistaceae bacterium]